MKLDLSVVISILVAVAGFAGTLAVSQWRINDLAEEVREAKGQPLRLSRVEWEVKQMRCDINNVKRILKNQPERDCESN